MIDNIIIIWSLSGVWPARGGGGGLKCKNGSVGLEYVEVSQAWPDKCREYSSTCRQHQLLSTVHLYSSCFHKIDNPCCMRKTIRRGNF